MSGFRGSKIVSPYLVLVFMTPIKLVFMTPIKIKLNKPLHIGATILEHSKVIFFKLKLSAKQNEIFAEKNNKNNAL